ncbi:MBOA4 acyltransferase, partial [Nothoprocta pentlandii]|nr:MBOA4 acyltransferase [Nothoprocta pentlandii]
MRWAELLILGTVASYQLAALPFAALLHRLCTPRRCSPAARYVSLLAGGCLLATVSTGGYAALLFIPAAASVLLLLLASPARVHSWAFGLQMSWQTLCHLGLRSQVPDPQDTRPAVVLSAIMLLTQKVTSVALDVHEGTVTLAPGQGVLQRALPLCSYLLSFPALLGGPLCSFRRFQAQVEFPLASRRRLGAAGRRCLCALALQALRAALEGPLAAVQGRAGLGSVLSVWAQALLFRLAYYSQWLLDEALVEAAGLGPEAGQGDVAGSDLWALESTNRVAVFARTWNRSTSRWLRRLVFQRCPARPLLATFAFSAWWHGLQPGQLFGFLCWALMVEADYRLHAFLRARAACCAARLLCYGATWLFTQLIVSYVLVAVETESFCELRRLWASPISVLPLAYSLALLLL